MSDYIKSIEEQIEELLKSDSDSVVDLVVQAQNYKELFEAKELSFDDYKELLVDLENTKVVEAAAGELEVRTKLNGLISTLISVGSLVV
jgi:hemerythrin-like domain-containing protein|tara:strand:- start:254 stop:520 length:267 start_codon:yes stop_codon:yes gene_type:complete